MQPNLRRGQLWIIVGLALILIVAPIIWFTGNRGTPQETLVNEIERELARVETVQGRVTITLQGVTLEQELWVQRPGFMRTETESGPSGFAGTIVVLNDTEGWVYSPALDMATVVDRASFRDDLVGDAGTGSLLERMPDQVLAALQAGSPTNVGDRTEIAGRAATLHELVIAPSDPSLPAGGLQVWLDDQYSYPVAWRDSNGRDVRFTSVTFNQEIDPVTFLFFPPPGASVRRVDPTQ